MSGKGAPRFGTDLRPAAADGGERESASLPKRRGYGAIHSKRPLHAPTPPLLPSLALRSPQMGSGRTNGLPRGEGPERRRRPMGGQPFTLRGSLLKGVRMRTRLRPRPPRKAIIVALLYCTHARRRRVCCGAVSISEPPPGLAMAGRKIEQENRKRGKNSKRGP